MVQFTPITKTLNIQTYTMTEMELPFKLGLIKKQITIFGRLG